MKKTVYIIIIGLVLLFSLRAEAQVLQIKGTVVEFENSFPIPGVSVQVKGTTAGTITDFDGNFSLQASKGAILIFSFVGKETKEVVVENANPLSIIMKAQSETVDEVVVTAFGIRREKKALGYSVTEVNTGEITQARETNVMNSLSGKVAGLQVTQTAGGPGSSARVIIRGNNSLGGNNQPLFVVDGISIDNSNHSTPTWLGGIDYGSGISDVNPDDIESITVLKGPNAAALYGSRAANGVIVITTKKGSKRKGIGVTINSNSLVETAYILGDYQNDYGMGFGGAIQKYELNAEQKLKFGRDSLPYYFGYGSWGPKISEYKEDILTWYGEIGKLESHPDNVKDYFETGYTLTNSVSLDGGNEKSTFRLSYTNLHNKGIKPNSKYDRSTFNLRGTYNLTKGISADAKVNYIRQDAFNREGVGDSRTGARNFIWMPRNIDVKTLKKYYKDENGYEQNWYDHDQWMPNPYWASYENTNSDNKDRVIGSVSLNFDITSWLKLIARGGTDFYNERHYRRIGSYSLAAPEGRYSEEWVSYRATDYDFLFTANKKIGANFDFNLNLGGSQSLKNVDMNSTTIDGFAVPNFFSLNNVKDPTNRTVGSTVKEWQVNSFYGSGQLAFRNYLFLDFTARNDWSSTLPKKNNSYFYPSISASWAITDAFEINSKILTFGKVRLSWAKVGNDANPYMLEATYVSGSFGTYPMNHLDNKLPLTDLKPETTESIETGGNLSLFENRINFDLTWYKSNTYNQIMEAEISKASGFKYAVINAGEIENKGIELQLNISPLRTQALKWDMTLNYASNKSKVISLAEDISTYTITDESQVLIEARPGFAYGNIVGATIKKYYKTDADGNIIKDKNNGRPLINGEGLYEYGEREIIGNITPDWTGGFSTSLSYKGFNMGFTLSFQKGGDIFSKTNKYGHDVGQFKATLKGRESWYAATDAEKLAGKKEDGTPVGYLAKGVLADGTENTKGIDPQVYWHQYKWGGIAELSVFDCSHVKLREVIIGYDLPASIVSKSPFTTARISVVGRNLWLIYSAVPNIDPESPFSSQNNGLGQEYAALPPTRNIGLNIQLSF